MSKVSENLEEKKLIDQQIENGTKKTLLCTCMYHHLKWLTTNSYNPYTRTTYIYTFVMMMMMSMNSPEIIIKHEKKTKSFSFFFCCYYHIYLYSSRLPLQKNWRYISVKKKIHTTTATTIAAKKKNYISFFYYQNKT